MRPPAPLFKTADSTKIVLTLKPSQDSRGSTIEWYYLYWNNGGNTQADIPVTSYSGLGEATITAADLITQGTIYQFKYSAYNQFGESDLSDFLLAAMSDFPD